MRQRKVERPRIRDVVVLYVSDTWQRDVEPTNVRGFQNKEVICDKLGDLHLPDKLDG